MAERPPARGARRAPRTMEVRGARVNNLKNIDVSIPLGQLVSIAGVSGSGKSSLALGVLYAAGSSRYLEGLSSYTRRRIGQAARPTVDSVEHVPAALALRQRPSVGGARSTFGTATELLNSLRLIYSRLGSHRCPNGHQLEPSFKVAAGVSLTCPECAAQFAPPEAEDFAFNSSGACPHCQGTGLVREINEAALVPDESKTLRDGAVAAWGHIGLVGTNQVAEVLGVRGDVPFSELTERERNIVFNGPLVERQIPFQTKNGKVYDVKLTYRNARTAVLEQLRGAETETAIGRLERFFTIEQCPECRGSRLNDRARSTLIDGWSIDQAISRDLDDLTAWVGTLADAAPGELREAAASIVAEYLGIAGMLIRLGLGYLSLDRASSSLSTGERQRVQLCRAVRSRTTGVLYVLDEPSIGLHPANVAGLLDVLSGLLDDGNSVVVVDHDVQVLREADWVVEIGPGSGADGGQVMFSGPLGELLSDPGSRIAPFIKATAPLAVRERCGDKQLFEQGVLRMTTTPVHTVHALEVAIPKGRLTAVTGVSGSGKTTLVLESLVPAFHAHIDGGRLPGHVVAVDTAGIRDVHVVDASPIGTNIRSTIGTYSGVLDDLRRAYAALPEAREQGLKAGAFSYNTGTLRCGECDGTGQISLDIQFLPDVDVVCPGCGGSRYGLRARDILRPRADRRDDGVSLPEALRFSVAEAGEVFGDLARVGRRLQLLSDLGLGYLTLGEATTALSGGEAQRLKLAQHVGRGLRESLFVFDEPSIGLHPLDVQVLLSVLQRLVDDGATVVIIEHDLDMVANADWVIDLGPGGGTSGGRIVAAGTPMQVARHPESVTGRFLTGD